MLIINHLSSYQLSSTHAKIIGKNYLSIFDASVSPFIKSHSYAKVIHSRFTLHTYTQTHTQYNTIECNRATIEPNCINVCANGFSPLPIYMQIVRQILLSHTQNTLRMTVHTLTLLFHINLLVQKLLIFLLNTYYLY